MRKLLLSLIVFIVLTVVSLLTVVYAWFYFPTNQNINIKTPNDLSIITNLYHLEDNVFKLCDFDEDDEDTYLISSPMSFYQWGFEFLPDDYVETQYYALECLYEAEGLESGRFKLLLNLDMNVLSDIYSKDKSEYTNLTFSKISYSFALSDINLEEAGIGETVKGQTYTLYDTYDSDENTGFNGVIEKDSENTYSYNKTYEYNIKTDLNTTQYLKSISGSSHKSIRIVILFKIEPDAANVGTGFNEVTFGEITSYNISTSYKFVIRFRTVPTKTK